MRMGLRQIIIFGGEIPHVDQTVAVDPIEISDIAATYKSAALRSCKASPW